MKGKNIGYIVGKCRNNEKAMSTNIITKRNSVQFFFGNCVYGVLLEENCRKEEKVIFGNEPTLPLATKKKNISYNGFIRF